MDREELLHKEVKRQRNDRVPLVITYSKSLPDIRGILRKHQDTLYMSERMQEVFAKPPLLAFRRDKNICDTLVHGKTNRALKTAENFVFGVEINIIICFSLDPKQYTVLIISILWLYNSIIR